jgi:uncharacterized protein (DUF488 family)
MMYYRRKILLSILEAFGGQLTRTQLQKLAFVFTRWQAQPAFDFVPYRYGCYSFQANQDLGAMRQTGLLEEQALGDAKVWVKRDPASYAAQLKKVDQHLLEQLRLRFKGVSQAELIRYTYLRHPYYAIRSTIAGEYLDAEQLERVAAERQTHPEKQLFTIGYEAKTLEHYLNQLLGQDVRLLCDVRKNSFSMKYGFSKSQLQHACEQVGIAFRHIPQLGIASDKRRALQTPQDYDALFDEYERDTLPENQAYLLELAGLFQRYPRIAITCFEAHHCSCHRGRVAKALQELPGWDVPVGHL